MRMYSRRSCDHTQQDEHEGEVCLFSEEILVYRTPFNLKRQLENIAIEN